MTAVRPSGIPTAGAEIPPGSAPRRVRPPRWLDLRLVLGVLLVLGSVLAGARVVEVKTLEGAQIPAMEQCADQVAAHVRSFLAGLD